MMRRYICPYGDDDREILPIRTIEVPKVILTCDSVGADIAPEVFVSRGSLLGYKNEIPVYASIDGIIAHIAKRKESYRKSVYDITVRRCAHGRMLWSEVPFFKYAGAAYFLRQLGISGGAVNAAHTVYVNAVETEPYAAGGCSLLMAETAKVVLGAAVLGRCVGAEKVIFYIERCFGSVDYVLNKYIKKYRTLLGETNFEVHYMPRRYPMEQQIKRPAFDVQTAVWAYQGFYEHEPAMDVCAAVSVFDGGIDKRRLHRTEVLRFPKGAVIEDILFHVGIKNDGLMARRFVIGGPMGGRAAGSDAPVGLLARQLCVFNEAKAESLFTDASGCIGCHLCERICPARLTPYLLNQKTLTKCIGCNICSYICPAKISLGERIKHAKCDKKSSERVHNIAGQSARRIKFLPVRRARYIEVAQGMDIPAAVQKSDAPPHMHSGRSEGSVYWAWIGAVGAVAAVKAAAFGFLAAGQMAFAAFSFMAFHEILQGLFPFAFRKSHRLKGVADGLTLGLVLTPAVTFQIILAVSFVCVLAEKILLKYEIRLNTPAAAALFVVFLCGVQNSALPGLLYGSFMPMQRWANAGASYVSFLGTPWALGVTSAVGGIFLWLSGYIYAAPAAITFLALWGIFHIPVWAAIMISIFFSQHLYPGGMSFLKQMVRTLLGLLILGAVYFF